jgi:prefoldin subunit 5
MDKEKIQSGIDYLREIIEDLELEIEDVYKTIEDLENELERE